MLQHKKWNFPIHCRCTCKASHWRLFSLFPTISGVRTTIRLPPASAEKGRAHRTSWNLLHRKRQLPRVPGIFAMSNEWVDEKKNLQKQTPRNWSGSMTNRFTLRPTSEIQSNSKAERLKIALDYICVALTQSIHFCAMKIIDRARDSRGSKRGKWDWKSRGKLLFETIYLIENKR